MNKPIPGFTGYYASTDGSIISHKRRGPPHKLKPAITRDGYPRVGLCREGRRINKCVHVLVLLTFRGKRPPRMVARHLDGNPGNNHLENLLWGTVLENGKDRMRHGTTTRGERQHLAKLNSLKVRVIRRVGPMISQMAMASIFGVRSQTILDVLTHRTWKHVLPGAEQ